MIMLSLVFFLLPTFGSCLIYIERMNSDCDYKLANLTVTFTHNEKGDSVTNVTFVNFVNVTKFMVYVNVRVPENRIDHEYKVQLFKTVADVEKVLSGLQSNPMIRGYVENIMKFMDFKVEFPLKPVSLWRSPCLQL